MLQSVVLAGLGACDGGVFLPGETARCVEHRDQAFEVDLPTDLALQLRVESCRVDADACQALCRMLMRRAELGDHDTCDVLFGGAHDVEVATTYTVDLHNPGCTTEGRRPAGLMAPPPALARTAIGAWLAHAAWLEAASIPAFVYLARELDHYRAPRGLVRAALAAARDEIRHAAIMRALAARYGAAPPPVEVAPPAARTLEAFAVENAIEGCVRETWGAVVAMWQAERARDAALRTAFRGIADDEARHAALAWAVDAWVAGHLDDGARARVAEARRAAVGELLAGDDFPLLAASALGLPQGLDARGLVARTEAALWNASAAGGAS